MLQNYQLLEVFLVFAPARKGSGRCGIVQNREYCTDNPTVNLTKEKKKQMTQMRALHPEALLLGQGCCCDSRPDCCPSPNPSAETSHDKGFCYSPT